MACLSLGLTPPTIPSIFLPSAIGASISFGDVGVTCCHFTIPTASVSIPIPIPAAALATAAQALNAAIAAAFATLDQVIIPSCPTE